MGVVSFTLRLFYPWSPLNWGLGRPRIRFEVLGCMMIIVNMHTMKAYGGVKVSSTHSLAGHYTEWTTSFKAPAVSSQGKISWRQLNTKFGGPQGRPGPSADKISTHAGNQTTFIGCPSHNTVTTATTRSGPVIKMMITTKTVTVIELNWIELNSLLVCSVLVLQQ